MSEKKGPIFKKDPVTGKLGAKPATPAKSGDTEPAKASPIKASPIKASPIKASPMKSASLIGLGGLGGTNSLKKIGGMKGILNTLPKKKIITPKKTDLVTKAEVNPEEAEEPVNSAKALVEEKATPVKDQENATDSPIKPSSVATKDSTSAAAPSPMTKKPIIGMKRKLGGALGGGAIGIKGIGRGSGLKNELKKRLF